MYKIIIITAIFIFTSSCIHKTKKDIVDENFVIENIKKGMSKNQVFELIGKPKDSLKYKNHTGKLVKVYSYNTNSLFDYDLNIVLDSTNTVISVNFD